MDKPQRSLYVKGKYERYFDKIEKIAEEKEVSFSELVGKAVKEYTG